MAALRLMRPRAGNGAFIFALAGNGAFVFAPAGDYGFLSCETERLRNVKMADNKLFAVMLGGNPPGAGVEVHDVVFTVGPTIEATYDQMLAAWFADGRPPHIDSWMELAVVDGSRIALTTAAGAGNGQDLWHVNLGYYEAGEAGFVEGHENLFVVAPDADAAKARAKQLARRAPVERLHTDAINKVSDRLAAAGSPFRVEIAEIAAAATELAAHDGYQPFPAALLAARRG